MNSTEVQNPWHKVECLCLLALRTLSLSFLTKTLPQTVRLFYISFRSQAPQQQYTVLSFSSMRRHGHCHKLTSSRALTLHVVLHCRRIYLSQTHRPIALHCMHYGITLWAYLSKPQDSHKRLSSTKNHNTACSKSRDHTLQ